MYNGRIKIQVRGGKGELYTRLFSFLSWSLLLGIDDGMRLGVAHDIKPQRLETSRSVPINLLQDPEDAQRVSQAGFPFVRQRRDRWSLLICGMLFRGLTGSSPTNQQPRLCPTIMTSPRGSPPLSEAG
jgi:hypothetical protein